LLSDPRATLNVMATGRRKIKIRKINYLILHFLKRRLQTRL
jgi:hypothetical protein